MDDYVMSQIYDEEEISKITGMIERELKKLKLLFESRMAPDLDSYNDFDYKFSEISLNLEELSLWEEQRYFLSIKEMVLYIIHENYIDNHFGHCNFALELFDFFVELFKANFEFYKNNVSKDDERYLSHQESYKRKYHKYREIFYQDIYEFSGNYTENELYEILRSLKD